MEWLNDIKEKFSKRRIRNLDHTEKYSRDFVDIESAKRIGIIINMNSISPDDLTLLKNYIDALKKRNKKLLLIEINFHKKSESGFSSEKDAVFINPSKLNWLDYPTPGIENKIRKAELDILMDFDFSSRMTSKYICSIARAKTRTGVHREGFESCYELMINHGGEQNMKAIIKEFDYFLNMIDNGNRVKV